MNNEKLIKDDDSCTVIAGTHKGKSGIVSNLNMSKTGHLTSTVEQENGVGLRRLVEMLRN